ncbi:LytTR family DNA-binding domain-containing protein [Streptococcus equinus]|uniref:LytTR family DNA-binding domain-containing protein n=1 Tax=Streptococcus equinus TaxID=1335 RepID=UPI000408A2EB|nr:LytTR family DNA-binding domain-containing protein [Streptococcus equinus]
MHYQFEEDSSLPKEAIEVLVRSGEYDQAVQDVLDYLARFNQEKTEVIPVKTAMRTELLRVSDLILIDVDGSSLILETRHGRLVTNDRLYKFRARLNNPDFVQVSKHAVLNINHLNALESSFSGNMLALLTNDIKTDVSRRYLSDLEKALGL